MKKLQFLTIMMLLSVSVGQGLQASTHDANDLNSAISSMQGHDFDSNTDSLVAISNNMTSVPLATKAQAAEILQGLARLESLLQSK